jgi:protoporphyrinogen/coproporphyrinogen III oxidase
MTTKRPHVVIVGGGITGLSAAFYLQKELKEKGLQWKVTLLESSNRLGGKIQTLVRDGFVMEQGPDSFLERKKSAVELVRDLGLADELVRNQTGQAYILHRDQLLPIPEGAVMGVPTKLAPFAFTSLVSPAGKVRAIADLFLPRSKQPEGEDQSIGSFFRRRLGDEVVDRIIEPLLSGIYAGDIDKLSLMSILPQFAEMEKVYRSLILATKTMRPPKSTATKPKGIFLTLKKGLHSMVEAIEEQLTQVNVIKGEPLRRVEKNERGYLLHLAHGEPLQADAIIMATPHRVTRQVLGNADFLKPLHGHPVSVATVILAFPENAVHLTKEGTGFVIPRTEPYTMTACTWTHKKWPHTTPPGKALLRCYVGRAGDEDIVDKPDDEIVDVVIREMKRIFPITGDPVFTCVTRWKSAMPQFVVGHQAWLKQLYEKMETHYPGVFLVGSSYAGSGIPDCIDQGKKAVRDVLKYLYAFKKEPVNQA